MFFICLQNSSSSTSTSKMQPFYRNDLDQIIFNRRRQIDTLKAFNENVTEIHKDVEYKIEFNSTVGPMTLFVTLPQDFPQEKPRIRVQPNIIHPWINDSEVIGAPGLVNYTMHSDLGRIVNAVIREFETANFSSNQANIIIDGKKEVDPNYLGLNHLSLRDLKDFQMNPEKFEKHIKALPQYKNASNALKNRISEIEHLAIDNLNKENQLRVLKQRILNKVTEVEELKREFEEKQKEYLMLGQDFEPENIQLRLQEAARESQIEADDIAEHFLNGEIDVEQFLTNFIEKRKLSQLRKTKEEKLGNQLQELRRARY